MTTNPFPYNQTLQAFTPTQGNYADNTFVISASSNGIGAGQIQPTATSSSSINYQSSFLYNILAQGSRTTALAFILNNSGVNQTPPYYFLLGSEIGYLWLYSFTPAADVSDFSNSNIAEVEKIDSVPFDSSIASILYYSPLSLLFIAGQNGNLYTYNVGWNNQGQPVFSYQGANKNYTNPNNLTISLSLVNLAANQPSLIVTGLTFTEQQTTTNGSFVFAISSENNGILANGTLIPGTTNSVATVVDNNAQLIYTATQNTLVANAFSNLQSAGNVIWTPTDQILLSLHGSANPNNVDNPQFSQGSLFIGTCSNTANITNTTVGSIYTYNPASGIVSPWQNQVVLGPPYALYADQNLHLLVNCGLTGLYYYSIVYTEMAPSSAELIPNTAITTADSNLTTFISVAKLLFQLYQQHEENSSSVPVSSS
ncbi:MAG: hypothetical protein GPI96_12015 [Microcystis aeruginosa BS13-02]|jgi:hypothetical protein|uniref:Uncharacterized protein n=1 Tax=Microcystis aeruginosa Ma_MB_S_20031200_S102 TaxID=2486254 RepID=A0A552EI97_MICAE|nr:hypothetical protein [Microcystis aeruginosa BS13-02]TRU20749.1 MAG: hypothetical protein EWV79_17275 [Microcystis aeruginosa Ma_MB_S_20031200_S102D]TRU34184.1 MAG: hypothetical protein EWV92_15890 [Microcystis aeruginosa Ma_MB_S_20031200_S102]